MRSLIRSNAHTQISGLIYSKVAELLFIDLLLVFIYPFSSPISGVDPTVPIEGQSQNKIVCYLQVAFPFFLPRNCPLVSGFRHMPSSNHNDLPNFLPRIDHRVC
jgi:hypothetical protein